jgi:hypothetical protein
MTYHESRKHPHYVYYLMEHCSFIYKFQSMFPASCTTKLGLEKDIKWKNGQLMVINLSNTNKGEPHSYLNSQNNTK